MLNWWNWDIFGSAADWFTGIVAAVALFFAGLASRAARETNRAQQETLKLQQSQFKMLDEQSIQAQASKVTYWWHQEGAIQIINASDSPIYQVGYVDVRRGRYHAMQKFLLPTGSDPAHMWLRVSIQESESWDAVLYFCDTSGRRWIRDYVGLLKLGTPHDMRAEIKAVGNMDPPMSDNDLLRLYVSWRHTR